MLCPRACGVNRTVGARGVCGQSANVRLARAALHFWEEPCISGTNGSGAVFFCGCSLQCVFCQNREIATGQAGIEIPKERLAEIPGLTFNSGDQASPYIINICVPTFMRSQTIIQELSANYGICVSSGSACAKGERSHVLSAMGFSHGRIDSAIRISMTDTTTPAEIDEFCRRLLEGEATLTKRR